MVKHLCSVFVQLDAIDLEPQRDDEDDGDWDTNANGWVVQRMTWAAMPKEVLAWKKKLINMLVF